MQVIFGALILVVLIYKGMESVAEEIKNWLKIRRK